MLHAEQVQWLENTTLPMESPYDLHFMRHKYAGLSAGNRWGKSETLAILHMWACIYKLGVPLDDRHSGAAYQTINVAPTADLSTVVYDKIVEMLQERPETSWMIKRVQASPTAEITFFNGAKFKSRTTAHKGRNILGRGYRLITFDECAFEPYFLTVTNQVLAKRAIDYNASILFTSTPNGMGSWKYFFDRKLDWKMYGDTRQNLFLNFRGLLEDLAKTDDLEFSQNILGHFVSGGGAVFAYNVVLNAIDPTLNGPAALVEPGHRYGAGLDIASKKDNVALMVLDDLRPKKRLVWWWSELGEKTTYPDIERRARSVQAYYGKLGGMKKRSQFLIDATGKGDPIAARMADIADPFVFSKQSKAQLIDNLVAAMEYGRTFNDRGESDGPYGIIAIPGAEVIMDSLFSYRRKDKDLPTDEVMALALALWSIWRYDADDRRVTKKYRPHQIQRYESVNPSI